MNYSNLIKNQRILAERSRTNVLQCLAEKRDASIHIRIPRWMREQIKLSGKSEADFIIAKLGETMFKPCYHSEESWQEEVDNW